MFKAVSAFAVVNNQTGYGLHATNFFKTLNNLIPVKMNQPGGDVEIYLLDSVSASHQIPAEHGVPRILYNIWESTLQPAKFIENLKYYDQLWVASEWQRQCSIDQGIDPAFVKVVPEGIDPSIYKPRHFPRESGTPGHIFTFLIVGKWEDRKYTREMIKAWMEVFRETPNIRLEIAVDNPFPVDQCKSTEERLDFYGLADPRIIPVHFESGIDHVWRLQAADVYLSCSRAEGWNLPLIEAMACGVPSIALDYSGSTEFAKDALLVKVDKMIKPINVYGMPDCPGEWAEPNYEYLKRVIEDSYYSYAKHKEKAISTSAYIRQEFSWKKAAEKAQGLLLSFFNERQIPILKPIKESSFEELRAKFIADSSLFGYEIVNLEVKKTNDIFVVGCWPNSQERMETLIETIQQIKALGYPVLISSHYPLPPMITEMVDYYLYEKNNILSNESFHPVYTRTNQNGELEKKESNIRRHDVACLNAIRNAVDFCNGRFNRMYYMEFDVEVDLADWISKVTASKKSLCFIDYENTGIRTDFFAGKLHDLDTAIPHIRSWDHYIERGQGEYVLENWLKKRIQYTTIPYDLIQHEVSNRFDQVDREIWDDDVFNHHFIEGPYFHINGISNREYDVSFCNPQDGNQFTVKQKCGTWSRPATKFYRDWEIIAKLNGEEKHRAKLDLKGKRVLIAMGSKALGDTLAWMPFVEEFRKKHECHVITASWWNDIFDYPELEFVGPGARIDDLYASYEIGCYDGDIHRNPADWRTVTLQKVAADILGLEYQEIKPKLKISPAPLQAPYVCFSEHSTMKAKLWNRDGAWQQVIDYLNDKDIQVISISKEESKLQNITKYNGRSIEDTISTMAGAEFYIGLGHGPSWLAWAVGVPVIMISGFSEPWAEFPTPHRIINENVCHGCFNDTSVKFDRGWDWCERNQNYICTKEITPAMVIEQIDKIRSV